MSEHGVVPTTGNLGTSWPASHVLTQGKGGSLSSAGWTEGNEGYPQQTFLGASIRSFNISAGFGDSTSTLSVQLVNDEFNKSDSTKLGKGDDHYHGGKEDKFRPPVVGTPVYFKFGKNHADIEQAYRQTFDDLYSKSTIPKQDDFPTTTTNGEIKSVPEGHYLQSSTGTGDSKVNTWIDKSSLLDSDNKARGRNHFVFGGILQSYTENKSSAGSPLYSVNITDPREILGNATVLFNNYQGTTFNNKNLFNVYGFLEYDVSDALNMTFESLMLSKNVLTKQVDPAGNVFYIGDDTYSFLVTPYTAADDPIDFLPPGFPITGQGFSRRSDRGIPWYRVQQALGALFSYEGSLPQEYVNAGFGGTIDFRGYKYVVDFSGIPLDLIPRMYFMDFDQLDMLSIAQELCDIISHDLYVTLLPVIDHPSCKFLYDTNKHWMDNGKPENIITGIIRVDAIDKNKMPEYGAIKSHLEDLSKNGVDAENQDVGFELSNVTTDKFVVGAQEVEMYYFNNNKDRDNLQLRKKKAGELNQLEYFEGNQWSLATSLKQQVLPFYGFLGEKAVTIPRGFGSYQQIMLDATSLHAHGVGNYYITTEMELRAALVSYEQWVNFLLQYDEIYIQELTEHQVFYAELTSEINTVVEGLNERIGFGDLDSPIKAQLEQLYNREFGVSVPRCVFNSDKNYMGQDGYPASPCAPPYGYPLYYKRAEKIGVPQAGIASIQVATTTAVSNVERLKETVDENSHYYNDKRDRAHTYLRKIQKQIDAEWSIYSNSHGNTPEALQIFQRQNAPLLKLRSEAEDFIMGMTEDLAKVNSSAKELIQHTRNNLEGNKWLTKNMSRYSSEHLKNAKRVYDFVRKVAEGNLGKKFLVKIPKVCNLNYDKQISLFPGTPLPMSDDGTDFTLEGLSVLPGNSPAHNINKGPFGFRPIPVNVSAGYGVSSEFITKLAVLHAVITDATIFEHYLDKDNLARYTYGALKCNFNPISEKWEHNYKPEPQGGFFNFALYNKNLSAIEALHMPITQLPPVTQQMLAPLDLTHLLKDEHRISCYARFDHSQFLDFSNVDKRSISQQSITVNGFIPDIMEELPNIAPDRSLSLDQIQARLTNDKYMERQGPSVAYVKCDVDEDLYMPPKVMDVPTQVWATDYTVNISEPPLEIKVPTWEGGVKSDQKEYSQSPFYNALYEAEAAKRANGTTDLDPQPPQPGTPGYYDMGSLGTTRGIGPCPKPTLVKRRITPSFAVPLGGAPGGFVSNTDFLRHYDENTKSENVDTSLKNLDSDHVYALITLPGRIKPSVDSRYLDGPLHAFNAVKLKNQLTQDVVRGVPGFEKPAPITNKKKVIDCSKAEFNNREIAEALQIQRDSLKGVTLSSPEGLLSFTSPSPVYPDMVAIPLMSMERCYGPWLSAATLDAEDTRTRYSDIGGKVEFVKDENLAPWKFAGYQLMNEAGSLQAQFSNSLFLFSERGGFIYPDAPTGIALAKSLKKDGPLVTSISVDVGNSIKTTVKMDLYTSSFGKLQKQKEGNIATIARERQKIIDQNNNAIRRGLGKSSSNNSLFGGLLANGGQQIIDAAKAGEIYFSNFEKQSVKKPDTLTFSSVHENYGVYGNETDHNDDVDEEKKNVDKGRTIRHGIQATMQNPDTLAEMRSILGATNTDINNLENSTGGDLINDMFTPYTLDASIGNKGYPSRDNKVIFRAARDAKIGPRDLYSE